MKKTIFYLVTAAFFSLMSMSCSKTDVVGGSVNNADENLNMTVWEWLEANEPDVAFLFEKGGYKDKLNDPDEDLLLFSPNQYSVNRYVRRRNYDYRAGATDVEFKIANIEDSVAVKMSMYIFSGALTREDLETENNRYLTAIDDSTEVLFSLDVTNTDPGSAYDGGNSPGYGFQYSNFLQEIPKIFHVLFKRGENWEPEYTQRNTLGYENAECDQRYRMKISDVRTKNGVIYVIYAGDASFDEHRYYHSLFFYGTRAADV